MAADVLDTSNMSRYLKRFRRYAKGSPRLWGLHNYGDVNRRRTNFTKTMLRTVPGEVWLTETGGIVKLLPSFTRSPTRAAARTTGMFRLANKYDTRRRGMRSKITRLFVYSWFGEPRECALRRRSDERRRLAAQGVLGLPQERRVVAASMRRARLRESAGQSPPLDIARRRAPATRQESRMTRLSQTQGGASQCGSSSSPPSSLL